MSLFDLFHRLVEHEMQEKNFLSTTLDMHDICNMQHGEVYHQILSHWSQENETLEGKR